MDHLEIEVKFHLEEISSIRRHLLHSGAESKGRFFETNIRYEDAENRLLRNKSLLRLRKDNRATLTFKSEPLKPDLDFKVHQELEVVVGDFETTDRILHALGFHRAQTYEKWRETLVLGDAVFCLDTLPFGDFLEIEGDREIIETMALKLGLAWETRILSNYLALFDVLKNAFQLPFSDITFDHFKSVQMEAEPVKRLIAGTMHGQRLP